MLKIYKNPPVVEAWVDFRFEYGEENPSWNQKIAVDFINSFDQFKKDEYPALFKKEIKVGQKGSTVSDVDVFVRLKALNSVNDRCLQVEQSLLVYNMLRRKDVEWPGFPVLLEEAIPFCQEYINLFGPLHVRPVLHYRDNITIPFLEEQIQPKDYFKIYPEVPEDRFGNMVDFSLSLILQDICKNGVTRFSVKTQLIASAESNSKLPFVLDWEVQSTKVFTCENLNDCNGWLISAHEGINKAFESCLTDKCRLLFNEE